MANLLCLVAGILVFLPAEGHAYVDPGSTSLLLQVLFASAIGFFLAFKSYIKDLFRKYFGRSGKDDDKS